jgi:acetolactate synthase-1/2/3 large subunit
MSASAPTAFKDPDETLAPKPVTGSQSMWQTLVDEGVEVLFGYPGGAIMPAYDALPHFPLHHVLVRHEQGAAHMADGYARASGKVGVAVATSGPGATNLVTGIATAMLDSIPMVCITGQVASSLIGTDAFQETDITGVTLPISKHNYLVTRAADVAPTLREAFYLARTGRPGPVVVDIAKNAQLDTCSPERSTDPVTLPGYFPERELPLADVERAAALMRTAERPVLIAGHGVIRAGASELLAQLVERTDIPVVMTLLGLGSLPADHPRSLGMVGMHGEVWANRAVQEADLVIALGMRFDDRVTGDLARFAPKARIIHVELDRAEINKNVKADIAIHGDIAQVLPRLLVMLERRELAEWNQSLDALRDESRARALRVFPGDEGRLHGPMVVKELWRQTGGDAVVVADVGQNQMWAAQAFAANGPRAFLTTGGLGTMGYGLPAAIGARMARPDANIWVVVGDGGFQMTAAELSTCAQEGLNLNIAIINNGYLGMVRQWQELFFESRYTATRIGQPDFVKLAEAHGHVGLRVSQPDQVGPAIAKAHATDGTVVVDFRVEAEDCVYPMVPAGRPIDDMLRRPSPEEVQP